MAATAEYVYTTRVCEPFNYQYYTLFRGGTYDQLPRGPYCQSLWCVQEVRTLLQPRTGGPEY